jgi:hypothetical protein
MIKSTTQGSASKERFVQACKESVRESVLCDENINVIKFVSPIIVTKAVNQATQIFNDTLLPDNEVILIVNQASAAYHERIESRQWSLGMSCSCGVTGVMYCALLDRRMGRRLAGLVCIGVGVTAMSVLYHTKLFLPIATMAAEPNIPSVSVICRK